MDNRFRGNKIDYLVICRVLAQTRTAIRSLGNSGSIHLNYENRIKNTKNREE